MGYSILFIPLEIKTNLEARPLDGGTQELEYFGVK